MTTAEQPPRSERRAFEAPVNPLDWFRDFGRPPRIMGLDVARALAILGMAGAHIGETTDFDWFEPGTWSDVVNGRSSILFAVLAGVSVALMTGRSRLPARERMPEHRLRLVGRGITIFLIGLFLEMLNTPIAVILTLYGLLYVAMIPFLRWRSWQLISAAAALAVSGPPLLALLDALTLDPRGAGVDFVLYGHYPITAWLAFALGGVALGRMHLERVRTAVRVLIVGVVLTVAGYGLGAVGNVTGLTGGQERSAAGVRARGWATYADALEAADPAAAMLHAVFAVEPHAGGTAELVGSGGFALAVIAIALLLARPLRWPLLPFAALGTMPLTAYTTHVVSIFVMAGPGGLFSDDGIWLLTSVMLLGAATVWSMFVGQGPLERLAAWSADRMAFAPDR